MNTYSQFHSVLIVKFGQGSVVNKDKDPVEDYYKGVDD